MEYKESDDLKGLKTKSKNNVATLCDRKEYCEVCNTYDQDGLIMDYRKEGYKDHYNGFICDNCSNAINAFFNPNVKEEIKAPFYLLEGTKAWTEYESGYMLFQTQYNCREGIERHKPTSGKVTKLFAK